MRTVLQSAYLSQPFDYGPEVPAELGALCANVEGVVDLAGLRRTLPYLTGPNDGADSRGADGASPAPTARPAAPPGPLRRLRAEEAAALNAVVLDFAGGSFASHLELALTGAAYPLARVASHILGPRPTQYCARLYQHPSNTELRTGLAKALAARRDGSEAVARLPRGIQAALASVTLAA